MNQQIIKINSNNHNYYLCTYALNYNSIYQILGCTKSDLTF